MLNQADSSKFEVLCQDCLRVSSFATQEEQTQAHVGEVRCQCGGDWCACGSCLTDIRLLKQGAKTTTQALGSFTSWTAEDGVQGFVFFKPYRMPSWRRLISWWHHTATRQGWGYRRKMHLNNKGWATC